MEVEVINTKDLTEDKVIFINKYILPEFDEYIVNPNRFEDNSKFVFILENRVIVSFARIFETEIEFKNSKISILGLSMVYSVEKGKGYGKFLIQKVMDFADTVEKVLIGNCEPKNLEFYRKCGLEVIPNIIKRFIYINPRNIAEINNNDSIVLIHDPKNEFITKFLKDESENIFIFEHWW